MTTTRRRSLLLVPGLAAAALAMSACTATGSQDASSSPSTTQTVPAAAVAEDSTVQQQRLSVASAQKVAAAALAHCQEEGVGFVTVAVVDRYGQVQAMLRGDNAAAHTLEAAQRKAYTAAAFGAPTSELAPRAVGDGATVADLPGTLFLPGGAPAKAGEFTIAGVGVGGAPDGAIDEACAVAGLAAIAEPGDA